MKYPIYFLLLLVSLVSCDEISKRSQYSGQEVAGKIGEILVVCESGIWNSEIQNDLDSGLAQFIMPYLPDVQTFKLIHKTPSHFEKGNKRYRNIVFIDIDPIFSGKSATLKAQKDRWANGQMIINIVGKDFNQVHQACKKGAASMHSIFDDISWRRLMHRFRREYKGNLNVFLERKFGINLAFPSNAKKVTDQNGFVRVEFPPASRPIEFVGTGTQDVGSIFSGLMVYSKPFTDSSELSYDNLLKFRDSVLKVNVPHEIDGLFMGTQYNEFVQPEMDRNVISADSSVVGSDLRGMYAFFNDAGVGKFGGAFWSYAFIHPKRKQITVLSGYVDAPPTTSWTHPIREIEAIIRSVQVK